MPVFERLPSSPGFKGTPMVEQAVWESWTPVQPPMIRAQIQLADRPEIGATNVLSATNVNSILTVQPSSLLLLVCFASYPLLWFKNDTVVEGQIAFKQASDYNPSIRPFEPWIYAQGVDYDESDTQAEDATTITGYQAGFLIQSFTTSDDAGIYKCAHAKDQSDRFSTAIRVTGEKEENALENIDDTSPPRIIQSGFTDIRMPCNDGLDIFLKYCVPASANNASTEYFVLPDKKLLRPQKNFTSGPVGNVYFFVEPPTTSISRIGRLYTAKYQRRNAGEYKLMANIPSAGNTSTHRLTSLNLHFQNTTSQPLTNLTKNEFKTRSLILGEIYEFHCKCKSGTIFVAFDSCTLEFFKPEESISATSKLSPTECGLLGSARLYLGNVGPVFQEVQVVVKATRSCKLVMHMRLEDSNKSITTILNILVDGDGSSIAQRAPLNRSMTESNTMLPTTPEHSTEASSNFHSTPSTISDIFVDDDGSRTAQQSATQQAPKTRSMTESNTVLPTTPEHSTKASTNTAFVFKVHSTPSIPDIQQETQKSQISTEVVNHSWKSVLSERGIEKEERVVASGNTNLSLGAIALISAPIMVGLILSFAAFGLIMWIRMRKSHMVTSNAPLEVSPQAQSPAEPTDQPINQPIEINQAEPSNDQVDTLLFKRACKIARTSFTVFLEKNPLGMGEFGKVFLGSYHKNNESIPVAVKIPNDPKSNDDVQSLLEECHIMAHYPMHVNVLCLTGVCSSSGQLFVLTEFCENGNLLRYVRANYDRVHRAFARNLVDADMEREASTVTETLLGFAYQAANGMEHLAAKNIIHRDLALRNMLLTKSNIVKVSDFGLSRIAAGVYAEPLTPNARVPLCWMAPESLYQGTFTEKSDTWSFGVVLWEMFTCGGRPFEEHDIMTSVDMRDLLHRNVRLGKPPLATEETYILMRDCWSENPNDRPKFSACKRRILRILDERSHSAYATVNSALNNAWGAMTFQKPPSNDTSSGSSSSGESENTQTTDIPTASDESGTSAVEKHIAVELPVVEAANALDTDRHTAACVETRQHEIAEVVEDSAGREYAEYVPYHSNT